MSILLIVIVAWVAVAAFFIALLAVAGHADRRLEASAPPPVTPEPFESVAPRERRRRRRRSETPDRPGSLQRS